MTRPLLLVGALVVSFGIASCQPLPKPNIVLVMTDDQTLEAMRTAGRLEGMITDPVYEGKSMAGMIDLVKRGEIAGDSNVLYAHLGGQPALSAYAGLFRA